MLQQINTLNEIKLDDCEAYADYRLTGWGCWMRAIVYPGPRRVTHEPYAIVQSSVTEYDDPEAEEIEAITASMMNSRKHHLQYLVLVCHYVGRYQNATVESYRDGVDVLRRYHPEFKVTKSRYDQELRSGRAFIAGILADRKKLLTVRTKNA